MTTSPPCLQRKRAMARATRVMATAMRVAGNKESNGEGGEGGKGYGDGDGKGEGEGEREGEGEVEGEGEGEGCKSDGDCN